MRTRASLGACLLAGLGPLALAVARTRAAGVPLVAALADGWAGERGASHAGTPMPFVRAELGIVLGALAVGGVVLAALVARARALGAALLAVALVGFASAWAGAPLGPTRFGAPVLAATAAACALAAASMQAIVRAVAEAKLPLARASAAMVLVLELAIPVDSADEALLRTLPRARGATAALGRPRLGRAAGAHGGPRDRRAPRPAGGGGAGDGGAAGRRGRRAGADARRRRVAGPLAGRGAGAAVARSGARGLAVGGVAVVARRGAPARDGL